MPFRLLARAFAALSLSVISALAHAVLSINEPWVRAAPDGRTAEVFVKLRSSEGATLSAIDSFAARRVEMRNPGARRPLQAIELPANTVVELKPEGSHLLMTGLVRRLRQGEHVPVTLVVRSADGLEQKLYINAEVRQHSPSEDEMNPHSHHAPPK